MACSYLDKLGPLCDVQDTVNHEHKLFAKLMFPTRHYMLINSRLFMKY
jgi:hypothetical protein